ncbi:type III secretion system inner rod subunit SctI (plasmid) [Mesorhizobium sp. AR07]|uniref:Type III secretion system inner rod subunit SctI n=1 Tax=Mesorhizobium huakuii TaxID=28104 RepID=A0A7G6T5V3_9HYPH|nr:MULTISPECIES: type III secretion system inner rod subunit SctI [Mesorhizobium]QND62135.1 type III secretion system inner rod subunit SctI [Mesorhizobium huakuii]QND69500.1 type III secretion system inner rod subunit SctI [Mesorhizobium loti]UVK49073.1 type III secretion system inner rod subunit SctI [Mesorhizobium sp. AR07]
MSSISPLAVTSVLPTDAAFVSELPTESLDAFRAEFHRSELSPHHDQSATDAIDESTEVARGSGVARTPGDAILSSMEKLSASFTHAVEAAHSTAGMEEIHSGDWLNAQLALSALSLECDMLAKVVGKATQSLDNFLRNQ